MTDEKLCDERHDKLTEELGTFREHCEKQHESNNSQIIRIHERLDEAGKAMDRLKDSINVCFHSAKNWLIITAVTIILSLIGTIATLAVGQVGKKSDLAELEKRLTVQFQVSESNNQMLRAMIESKHPSDKK